MPSTVLGGEALNKTLPAPETNNKQINQHIYDIRWFLVLWRKSTQAKEARECRVLLFLALLQGASYLKKEPAVSYEYGKAEGTARTKALRWGCLGAQQGKSPEVREER